MDEILLQKLLDLIRDGKQHAFYTWAVWRKTKSEVLRLDHYECQKCKARKKYSHAVVVHHVNHLREHPELALNIWYDDKETGEKKTSANITMQGVPRRRASRTNEKA